MPAYLPTGKGAEADPVWLVAARLGNVDGSMAWVLTDRPGTTRVWHALPKGLGPFRYTARWVPSSDRPATSQGRTLNSEVFLFLSTRWAFTRREPRAPSTSPGWRRGWKRNRSDRTGCSPWAKGSGRKVQGHLRAATAFPVARGCVSCREMSRSVNYWGLVKFP